MITLRNARYAVDVVLLLLITPLVGIAISGRPIVRYLEFPPLTRYVEHAGFLWPAFIGLALVAATLIFPFAARVISSQAEEKASVAQKHAFPWWGWLGAAIIGVNWALAWNRFEWFAPLQEFTFSPFWFGYILVVNGLTFRRSGHCMLKDRPAYMAGLFVLSAAFWWCFEYLNRFVQNWYYEGIGDLSRLQYFFYATLPFSTVLPAVLGTRDLLDSYPRLSAGLQDFLPVRAKNARALAWTALLISCAGLAGIGVWPDFLFPLLWLAPLFAITALQCIRGRRTIFSDLEHGNWRNIVLLALAALICGFFWEMWNFRSLAKWVYAVPFVGRFKVFEMPVLGYIGYLPFGLECAVVADLLSKDNRSDADALPGRRPSWLSDALFYVNKIILCLLALYFFILPGFTVMRNIADASL